MDNKIIKYLAMACGIENVVFGIEANKMDCAELFASLGAKVVVLKKKKSSK